MSCSRLLKPYQATLRTDTTTVQYVFSDQWLPAASGAVMDFALLLRNVSGNFTAKPAIQLTDVRPDDPDAPAEITDGSFVNTSGYTHYHEAALGGASKAFMRYGIAYRLSTGSSLGTPQVSLVPSIQNCVKVLGNSQVLVNPGMVTTTDLNYAEITGWQPAVGFSKFKAAFVVTENESSYLEYQLVMRTAIDTRAPNAWQTAEAGYTNPSSANTGRNTGELSAPAGASITSNMFWQAGIAYRKKSGAAGNPRAIISVVTVVISE